MGVDRAVDISGQNSVVVFQEKVLQAFQHVSDRAWTLPVDSYKRVGAITEFQIFSRRSHELPVRVCQGASK